MVFDAHADIWSDVTVKSLQNETDIFRKYHYERLQKGQIEGSILAMWIDPPYDKQPQKRLAQIMEAVQKEVLCCQDILRVVHDNQEMRQARENNIFYVFIGCEGLSGIVEDIEQIDRLYEFGVRHMSLTWNEQNALATGILGDEQRGLTKTGKNALRKIQNLPILFDVSHLNDKSFWDVIDNASAPVIATHSNSRALCPVPRNLTDEMIKALIQTGGMIGVNAYPAFISPDKDKRTVEMLVRHIAHIADIAGIDNVGFGFDFCEFLEDGTSFSNSLPEKEAKKAAGLYGLQDASEAPNVLQAMHNAGFTEDDIRKVSYENWHRLIQKIM